MTDHYQARLAEIEHTLTMSPGPDPIETELVSIVRELLTERNELREMLMDAVNQGARQHPKNRDRVDDGCLGTWEEILPWLAENGLAEGNTKDGYLLLWKRERGS